jgi:hypothetical protein
MEHYGRRNPEWMIYEPQAQENPSGKIPIFFVGIAEYVAFSRLLGLAWPPNPTWRLRALTHGPWPIAVTNEFLQN